MTAERDLAQAIANAVDAKVAGMRPESSTMPATYQGRDAEGKGWVLLPGATDPTPVSRMAVEADLGDTVSVTVANGKATVDSNVSNPSAGLAGVKVVERTANTANATASNALTAAYDARSAATSAQASADTARQAANEAVADASTARSMAESASSDAAAASESAAIAKQSADKAAYALSDVENVVGTVNWIAEHGEYVLTSDTAIVEGKAYYTRSGTAPNYVYTLVTEPRVSELSTYYELEIDESVQNYLASHIYLLNDGLYVTTDSATGYKVRIDGDSVDVLDASGNVMATFGTTARVGTSAGQNIKIDSDSVDVCTGTTVDATISASGASFLQGNANITAFLEGDDFRGINLTASDPSTYLRIVNDLEDGGGVPYSGVMLSKLLAWGPSETLITANATAIVNAANKAVYKTGGDMFGQLSFINDEINRDAAAPSSKQYGQKMPVWRDVDGEMVGYIQAVRNTDGRIGLQITPINEKSDGTSAYGAFTIFVDDTGETTYGVNNAANFRSAINAASKSGETFTGSVVLEPTSSSGAAYLYLDSTNINRDGAAPSATTVGNSRIILRDADNENFARIITGTNTSGVNFLQFYVYNENSGTEVSNVLTLNIAKNGSQTYSVSNPANFRTAIGITKVGNAEYTINSGYFVLTNSAISSTSVVICQPYYASGTGTSKYTYTAQNSSGSANIYVRDGSGTQPANGTKTRLAFVIVN